MKECYNCEHCIVQFGDKSWCTRYRIFVDYWYWNGGKPDMCELVSGDEKLG